MNWADLIINGLRGAIGSFGDLVFEVYNGSIGGVSLPGVEKLIHDERASQAAKNLLGGTKVLTFNDYTRRTRARYAKHEIMNRTTQLEKVGDESETLTLTIKLVRDLGVEPDEQAELIRGYIKDGHEDFFVLGSSVVGQFVITELEELKRYVDAFGRTQVAELRLTLESVGDDDDVGSVLSGIDLESVIIH